MCILHTVELMISATFMVYTVERVDMSQTDTQPDADGDPLDHTFEVQLNDITASARLIIDDEAEPSVSHELPGEMRVRGRTLPVTFKPHYPTTGVGTRDTGEYRAEFDRPLHAFNEQQGDFILGAATAVVIPDEVGDRICEQFDIDTLGERANEVADQNLISQLRARIEYGDDEELREEVEAILDRSD